jgi:hypothetical protein
VATIANQMFNAAQAKTKLIARIFAETGIRDMFSLLHAVVRKHGSVKQTVRLRNKWVNVDPRQWRERADMTINVGLGNGTQSEQIAHMTTIIAMQKEALAAGKTNLVNDANLYNSAKQMTKLVKLKDVDSYFTDPKGQPAPAPPVNPKVEEIKLKAEVEKLQAQADMAVQKQKTEAEIIREDRKAAQEMEAKRAEHMMKMDEHRLAMAREAFKVATMQRKNADGTSETVVDQNLLERVLQSINPPPRPRQKTIRKNSDGSFTSVEH